MNIEQAQQHWNSCLTELQLQMTRATFDTWLRGSRVVSVDDHTITIYVGHAYAVDWLQNRLMSVILRTAQRHIPLEDLAITFVDSDWDRQAGAGELDTAPIEAEEEPGQDEIPTPRVPKNIVTFNPNTAETGGFSLVGNYANTYWAAYLGTVSWRLYNICFANDKRRAKTDWTPPRSYAISALARSVPCSRNAIRGRWRTNSHKRIWRPGAFDRLTMEGLAIIQWHDNNPRWRRWHPAGFDRGDSTGQRIIYRLSVLTTLPLLTPRQVAQLPADIQRAHERYLTSSEIDILLWEQIRRPTLTPLTKPL